MITVHKSSEMTALSIAPPKPALDSFDRPMTSDELRRVADRMTQSAGASGMKLESLGFGQAPAASHIWAWQAFKMADMATPNLPEQGADLVKQMFDGGRVWRFHGTAGNWMFDVSCVLGLPKRIPETERGTYVADHAAIFGEILRRMSISVVQ